MYTEATYKIANLIQSHLLWVDESHGVFEIKVALAIVVEAPVSRLDDGTVDQIGNGTVSNLLHREVGKEEIEIRRNIGLGSVLDNAIAVFDTLACAFGNLIEGPQTVWSDLLVTLFELGDELRFVDPFAQMRCTTATRLTNLLASIGGHIALLDLIRTSCDSGIEVQGRSDKVDVVLEMLGKTVLVTSNMRLTSSTVLVNMVLGIKQ